MVIGLVRRNDFVARDRTQILVRREYDIVTNKLNVTVGEAELSAIAVVAAKHEIVDEHPLECAGGFIGVAASSIDGGVDAVRNILGRAIADHGRWDLFPFATCHPIVNFKRAFAEGERA